MTNPAPGNDRNDRAAWLRMLYQVAHSDTRWAKEQSWRVVNWGLLLFAANLGIYKFLLEQVSPTVFALLDALVAVIAVLILLDLHRSASGTRATTSKIQAQIPDIDGILDRREVDREHVAYFGVQVAVVVVSLVLAVLALVYVR